MTDDASPHSAPWLVATITTNSNGMTIVDASGVSDEMEAHDVASHFVSAGCRAFLINPDGENGTPTIEEYGLDDD